MKERAADLRMRIARRTGLTPSAIAAAWPAWWSEDADASPSAQAELRFSLARKLGLDPRTLRDDTEPRFVWDDSVKYKKFTGRTESEGPAIASFGMSVSRMLFQASGDNTSISGLDSLDLRRSLLRNNAVVGLRELLGFAWAVGIPVIHLRVFPLAAKRMAAMTARRSDRHAVLIAHDASYPATLSFFLAHEIGHIALGHVQDGSSIVDADELGASETDPEEQAADAYALELLTGFTQPPIRVEGDGRNARELAQQAQRIGLERGIEPGTLALCFGYATGEWAVTNKALTYIYPQPMPAWKEINELASSQLRWSQLDDDSESFVRAVIGGI